jgi:hypothetical protein
VLGHGSKKTLGQDWARLSAKVHGLTKMARWKPKLRSEELIELQTTFPLTGQGVVMLIFAWQSSPRGKGKGRTSMEKVQLFDLRRVRQG